MLKIFLTLVALAVTLAINAQTTGTYQFVQDMLKNTKPQCAFTKDVTAENFQDWQSAVSRAMEEIMCHPAMPSKVDAKCIAEEQMPGYKRQTYSFRPFPNHEQRFIVLVPDKAKSATPAVLCIPGSGMTMEQICDSATSRRNWATQIARAGFIAVAVENACAGTQEDEGLKPGNFDYNTPSRILLELGWSWLGFTSYCQRQVLQWMKQQRIIRTDRICVAGFSLGTEPLMVLGALDKDIHAFIYNDFLCNTQERAVVLTQGKEEYARPFPNSIRHLIPNWWRYFNFPDVVASLAPRPIILTEGGMDRDFDLVRKAYEVSGHPENVELHHYARFADESSRIYLEKMPEDVNGDIFFRLANVDGKNHYFKSEYIIPWLYKVMK